MRIGLYQNHPEFGEKKRNIEQVTNDLAHIDADLMVLPELFATGYQFISKEEAHELAEEIPKGQTCQAMMSLAREKKMFIVFGIAEKNGEQIYNSAAVVGPEGLVGLYRKTHLFLEEKHFFEPGDTGFRVFDIGSARIGVMICFDWRFPESCRVLALQGADIICHPANLILPHCQRSMLTRSLENHVFTITANRIGVESRGGKSPLTFTGKSQIVDTEGKMMTNLGENDTGILMTDIDPKKARNKTVTPLNDWVKDRRVEFYGPLTEGF